MQGLWIDSIRRVKAIILLNEFARELFSIHFSVSKTFSTGQVKLLMLVGDLLCYGNRSL